MQLASKKDFLPFLAAILVVALGIMAVVLSRNYLNKDSNKMFNTEIQQMQTQSESDNLDTIEKDLEETNLNDIDKELLNIEKELNQVSY